MAQNVVHAVIPVLLLIGMAHVETLFRDRARVEQDQRLRLCELEQCLDRRTEELVDVKEEFHRELARRDQAQQAFAQRAHQARLELGVQVAAKAAQRLNRHLAVIELYAKLLLARQIDQSTAQYYERLLAGAAEARDLGRQLLDCGRCHPPRIQLISLGEIVRRHQPTLQKLLGEHALLGCTCRAFSPVIWADPQMVRWMLEELVRNAREALAETGHVNITVEPVKVSPPHSGRAAASNGFVSVAVTDSGRGMEREVQQHLSEPFFTTNPASRAGLGLARVSGLMKAHGGWLEVTSAPGHGTAVRLFFPAAKSKV